MLDQPFSVVQHSAATNALHNPIKARADGIGTVENSVAAGYPISAAYRVLAFSECLTVIGSAILAKVAYLDWLLQSDPDWFPYLAIALGLGLTLHITYQQMGLYEIEKLAGPEINFGSIFGGLANSFLIVLGVLYALKQSMEVSRGWVLVWLVLTAVLIIPVRVKIVRQIKSLIATGIKPSCS